MNAIFLVIPLFVIRFGLLSLFGKDSLKRASLFAPLVENEKIAYLFYQISNLIIIIYLFILELDTKKPIFIIGLLVYCVGILVLIISTINFALPSKTGLNTNGIYKISRNPMYIGYFLYFLGCVLLTYSKLLFLFVIIFILSSHWIILSEERWCIEKFGKDYKSYMKKVRRYI